MKAILITIKTTVNAEIDKVWECWTNPNHITQWNNATDDWHTPKVENNLTDGGRFSYHMAAKDGSMAFDFSGTYTNITVYKKIEYTIDDGRKVEIDFDTNGKMTTISEVFEAESINPVELQEKGWQAILDNFKSYVEKKL